MIAITKRFFLVLTLSVFCVTLARLGQKKICSSM